jgi:hypothetical protein
MTHYYLLEMKLSLWASLLVLLAAGSPEAQEAPTSFSCTWESGEVSLDLHIEDNTWQLDGRNLKYNQTISGRDEGMPKLKTLLTALMNERSLSLLPKDYRGTLLSYSLSFGNPAKEVDFAAPQFTANQMNEKNPPGKTPPSGSSPAGILLFKFDELRDYLIKISS